MTALTEGARLRAEGQQQSLGVLLPEDVENFMRIIGSYPVGTQVSINVVRSQLDALNIPDSSRGGLFRKAQSAGLIAPATVAAPDGREFPLYESSTGRSAHNARVRIYVRTDPGAAS